MNKVNQEERKWVLEIYLKLSSEGQKILYDQEIINKEEYEWIQKLCNFEDWKLLNQKFDNTKPWYLSKTGEESIWKTSKFIPYKFPFENRLFEYK